MSGAELAQALGLLTGYFLTFGRPSAPRSEKLVGLVVLALIVWWLAP